MWGGLGPAHPGRPLSTMLGRYKERFTALTPEAAGLVWVRARERHPALPAPAGTPERQASGEALFEACMVAGLSHAEVVMSIAREQGPVAESALTALVGHPLTRPRVGTAAPTQPQQRRTHRATPAARSDPRVIRVVAPACPKKPGTNAWRLWQLYRDGMTADEYIAAGGTRAAIRYDSDHGFIRLESSSGQ